MKKLRFSILGAGTIAHRLAEAASYCSDEMELYAVASRDLQKAQQFAGEYGFQKAYGSYEQLVADPECQLVYVATPHNFHYEQVKLCLEAGKHVLCEKPFTVNAKQAAELFQLSEQKGLFLMEAMWSRFLPYVSPLKELLASGKLGKPRSIRADFGGRSIEISRICRPELAGGALLDLGTYCLHFADLFFGQDICSVVTQAELTDEGVDAQSCTVFQYQDGRLAVLGSSVVAPLKNQGVIFCEKGYVQMNDFWKSQFFTVYEEGKEPETYSYPFGCNGYEYQLKAVKRAIEEGRCQCPQLTHEDSLRILRQMDQLREQWGMVYPFERV